MGSVLATIGRTRIGTIRQLPVLALEHMRAQNRRSIPASYGRLEFSRCPYRFVPDFASEKIGASPFRSTATRPTKNADMQKTIPSRTDSTTNTSESRRRKGAKMIAKPLHDSHRAANTEAQAHAHEEAKAMKAESSLARLRRVRSLSQKQLAAALQIKQPAVAKMEKKADMYISTLRRFIAAMGGRLEIRAHFPDGEVRINQFEDPEKK